MLRCAQSPRGNRARDTCSCAFYEHEPRTRITTTTRLASEIFFSSLQSGFFARLWSKLIVPIFASRANFSPLFTMDAALDERHTHRRRSRSRAGLKHVPTSFVSFALLYVTVFAACANFSRSPIFLRNVIYTGGAKPPLFSPPRRGRCKRGIFRFFGCGFAALGSLWLLSFSRLMPPTHLATSASPDYLSASPLLRRA